MFETLKIPIMVLGGLGIFLLGMKNLSEGLQAVAGHGLRKFMSLATTRRLAGVGTGAISTILVQSSSVITVMLVSFVSSGFMSLAQAFNVIIGANVGTTATVWIVAFAPDPQVLGLLGMGIGGAMYFFVRNEKCRNLGLSIVGLALVFLGMYFMSKGVLPIRQNNAVRELLMSMNAQSFAGVALVALVAAVFTAVVQSSAATIAIGMTLASQQLITYETAISILFGANIGTTMTAWLAAIGSTAAAKRTALAHTLSNIIGSLIFIPLVLPVLVPLGQWMFPNWHAVTETAKGPVLLGVMAPIAVTDTIFSVLRGAVFYPLARPFISLVEKLIPQKEDEKPHLSVLKTGAISPVVACDLALVEVQFMRDSNLELFECVRKVLTGESDAENERHIIHREDILDNVQREVTEYLGGVMKKRLPGIVANRSRRLLRITDELESASDEATQVLKVVNRLKRGGLRMSDKSAAKLISLHDATFEFVKTISPWIRSPRPWIDIAKVQNDSKALHDIIKDSRLAQVGRIGPDDPGSPLRVLGELDIINAYDRVRAYYLNIAESLAGGK